MLEIMFALVFGIFAGVCTGLVPGVHVNLISVILLSISGLLLQFTTPLVLSCFIIAMAVTHTFVDTIPSVFLGAPDPGTVLNVLPGHKMLLRGMGYEAVKLTVIGSLLSLIITVCLIPLLILKVETLYEYTRPYIGYVLIGILCFMILKEGGWKKKGWGILVMGLAGLLGVVVLNSGMEEPLLPMLSGLFGTSMLISSLSNKVVIPKQYVTDMVRIGPLNHIKAVGASVCSGSITGLFPGVGSAAAALMSSQVVGNIGAHSFMVMIGGINTVNFVFSISAFYAIQKARNGAVAAVLQLTQSINVKEMWIMLFSALIVGGVAAFVVLYLAKTMANVIGKVNYRVVCVLIILLVVSMVAYFSGMIGMVVLFTATGVGMIAPIVGVKRSNAMACLMVPVIGYFL